MAAEINSPEHLQNSRLHVQFPDTSPAIEKVLESVQSKIEGKPLGNILPKTPTDIYMGELRSTRAALDTPGFPVSEGFLAGELHKSAEDLKARLAKESALSTTTLGQFDQAQRNAYNRWVAATTVFALAKLHHDGDGLMVGQAVRKVVGTLLQENELDPESQIIATIQDLVGQDISTRKSDRIVYEGDLKNLLAKYVRNESTLTA